MKTNPVFSGDQKVNISASRLASSVRATHLTNSIRVQFQNNIINYRLNLGNLFSRHSFYEIIVEFKANFLCRGQVLHLNLIKMETLDKQKKFRAAGVSHFFYLTVTKIFADIPFPVCIFVCSPVQEFHKVPKSKLYGRVGILYGIIHYSKYLAQTVARFHQFEKYLRIRMETYKTPHHKLQRTTDFKIHA